MFSLTLSKAKVLLTTTVCLVVIVISCLTGIQDRRIHKEASLWKLALMDSYKNDSLFNSVLDREKDITVVPRKSSPFINSVFDVGVSSSLPSRYHTILFLESPSWFEMFLKSLPSNINHCAKYTNCKQSFDRSLYKTSKAVVFNLPKHGVVKIPPLRLNPDQVWVFFTLESPLHINPIYKSVNWHNVFNWSWTYHPNADIFHPYGVLVEKNMIPSRNYSNIYREKKKIAAWVVSNCNVPSKRNEFVNILKRFVDVDVFGACGKTVPVNLEKYINEHYKFYLGFENSLCENYMTEKFFHYYKLDVITVLRGHTNYARYLPSDSFIDTANFTSISALAKFMKDLAENEEKYVSYLKVKDKYTVYEFEKLFKKSLCKLCEKLNNIEKNRKTYGDIYKWLGPCFEANDIKI